MEALPTRHRRCQAGISRGPRRGSDPRLLTGGIAVSNVEAHLLGGLGDLQRGEPNLIFKEELFNSKDTFSHGLMDSQLVLSGFGTGPWVPAKSLVSCKNCKSLSLKKKKKKILHQFWLPPAPMQNPSGLP